MVTLNKIKFFIQFPSRVGVAPLKGVAIKDVYMFLICPPGVARKRSRFLDKFPREFDRL